MPRFHISNGVPSRCKAQPGRCPLGGEHYETAEEAIDRAEQLNEANAKRLESLLGPKPPASQAPKQPLEDRLGPVPVSSPLSKAMAEPLKGRPELLKTFDELDPRSQRELFSFVKGSGATIEELWSNGDYTISFRSGEEMAKVMKVDGRNSLIVDKYSGSPSSLAHSVVRLLDRVDTLVVSGAPADPELLRAAKNKRGADVALLDAGKELTPNEVADILKVSRPYVVKLMDRGILAFRMVGTHRREAALADAMDEAAVLTEEDLAELASMP